MTQRERAERLVREETRAIVVRLVRKLSPGLPVATVDRSAAQSAVEVTLTDAEVERCMGMTDDEVRESWRAHYEPKLTAMFAGEMPS